MTLTRGADNGNLNRQSLDWYAACPSVLTIPWRCQTVSHGRRAPA